MYNISTFFKLTKIINSRNRFFVVPLLIALLFHADRFTVEFKKVPIFHLHVGKAHVLVAELTQFRMLFMTFLTQHFPCNYNILAIP